MFEGEEAVIGTAYDITARKRAEESGKRNEERLEIQINGAWQTVNCSLFSNALGTGGNTCEAPLVYFASETDYQREGQGRIVE